MSLFGFGYTGVPFGWGRSSGTGDGSPDQYELNELVEGGDPKRPASRDFRITEGNVTGQDTGILYEPDKEDF